MSTTTTMLSSTTLKPNPTFLCFSPSKPTSPTSPTSIRFIPKRNPSKIHASFNQISDDLLNQYPVFKTGYEQFQQVTEGFPESEKWGVIVFAGLVWVYLTARPGVLIGAIDAYVLAPAQKVFDGLSGRRNLRTSDFLIGDKLGEGSFGVVYSGVVVPKNMTVEDRVRNTGSRRKQLEKDPRFNEKVILKQVKIGVEGAIECGDFEEWFNYRLSRAAPDTCAEFLGFISNFDQILFVSFNFRRILVESKKFDLFVAISVQFELFIRRLFDPNSD